MRAIIPRNAIYTLVYFGLGLSAVLLMVNVFSAAATYAHGQELLLLGTTVYYVLYPALSLLCLPQLAMAPILIGTRNWLYGEDPSFKDYSQDMLFTYQNLIHCILFACASVLPYLLPLLLNLLVIFVLREYISLSTAGWLICAAPGVTFLLFVLRPILARLVMPIVAVLTGIGPHGALEVSLEIIKGKVVPLLNLLGTSVLFVIALQYLYPMTLPEWQALTNKAFTKSISSSHWDLATKAVAFAGLIAFCISALCTFLFEALRERSLQYLPTLAAFNNALQKKDEDNWPYPLHEKSLGRMLSDAKFSRSRSALGRRVLRATGDDFKVLKKAS